MPNSKFCDDVESVVGVPISVIFSDLTLFFSLFHFQITLLGG
jgi:hypothetical protein